MMWLVQVWQAILVRQVDLDSPQAKQQLSEGARDLLSVSFELHLSCPVGQPGCHFTAQTRTSPLRDEL